MIELTLHAAFRLMDVCFEPAVASRLIAADLATSRAVVGHPGSYEGVAEVLPSDSSRVVIVSVRVTPRTAVRYTWTLSPNRGTTELHVAVQLESRGPRYRLALMLGGTRWLQQRLEVTLARISHVTVCDAEDMDAAQTGRSVLAFAP